jgi:hypothetical protein
MLLALVGMTISATIGTLASASPLSEGIAAAIWALGWRWRRGSAPVWWIALQWSIALVIAAAFPADPTFALLRSVLVALGVTLQLVIASSLWALVCWPCDVPAPRNANDRPLCLASVQLALRETFEPGTSRFRYAVALAVLITGYIAPLFAFGGLPGAGRGIASGHCHRDRRRCRACRTFSLRRPSCAPCTATSLLSRSYWARTAPVPERRSRGCGITRLSRDRGSSGRQKEPEIDSRQGSHAPPRRLST